jgi:hypothetical protein
VGLEKENDYRYLPIIANYSWTPLHKANLRRLWPILLIILGIVAFKIHPHAFSYKQWGYVLLLLGGLFLLNNLHFNISSFDAYHGDQQARPYQDLIDYVNKKNGLVFWAHPEAKNIDRVKDVNIVTSAYKEDLIYTHDYAGSAMLFDDSRSVAKTGDIWDKLLIDACLGRRKPVWMIGEVDYHGEGANLDSVQTIFLLEALSRIQVINALKNGKMYAKLNNKPNDFSLDAFIITDDKKENFAFMGDEIELNSMPQIIIQTSSSSNPQAPITILLIRNNQLIQEFTSQNPNFQVRFQDEYFKPGEKIYYRIMIREDNDSFRVISNPVFVKFTSD